MGSELFFSHAPGLPQRSLVWLACLFCAVSSPDYMQAQSPGKILERISFDTQGKDILHALIQLASEEKMGLGIALDGTDVLCRQPQTKHFAGVAPAQVVSELLANSNSKWFIRNGILEIRPSRIPESEVRILDMRFNTYNGMNTTIQGLGVILSGYIRSRLFPGRGYAGNILSSTDAEKVTAFTLQNASVEEIADYIVSRGTKGIWLLHALSDGEEKRPRDVDLKIYGYKDDGIELESMSCSEIPQE